MGSVERSSRAPGITLEKITLETIAFEKISFDKIKGSDRWGWFWDAPYIEASGAGAKLAAEKDGEYLRW